MIYLNETDLLKYCHELLHITSTFDGRLSRYRLHVCALIFIRTIIGV